MNAASLACSVGLLLGSIAPFQCAGEAPPTSGEREDTPGEALKRLADEFEKAGDREARVRTLKFLVERYPRSRAAAEAEVELGELGVSSASAPVLASAPPRSAPQGVTPPPRASVSASAAASSTAP